MLLEGELNRNEASFLLSYAIGDLLNAGVQFMLDRPYDEEQDEAVDDDSLLRLKFPERGDLN